MTEKNKGGSKRKMKGQSKGITLIALVITIILLLILAGITLSQLTGENGLFAKAKEARKEAEIAEYKEALEMIGYDISDQKITKGLSSEEYIQRNKEEIEKPVQYNKMVELAEKLSMNIPFVRVDFYQKEDKIYFGELTFYPGSGVEEFTPEKWDYELGSWIKLPIGGKDENKEK